MMNKIINNISVTVLLACLIPCVHYLMASNIDGDAGVGRATGIAVGVDTSDILETLEMGAMIHLEGQHSNGWGVMFDYAFMKLGDDLTGPRGGITDVTVRQGVLEAMIKRRIDTQQGTLDLYGGLRWWDNDVSIMLDPVILPGTPEARIAEDWIDPVIGLRYLLPLNESWNLSMQADVGGLSLGSDLTYAMAVGATYRFTESMVLDLKYKGLWVDYEDGEISNPGYFMYDTVTHGFIIGLIFEL
jgi:hypothetical protein